MKTQVDMWNDSQTMSRIRYRARRPLLKRIAELEEALLIRLGGDVCFHCYAPMLSPEDDHEPTCPYYVIEQDLLG